MAEIAQYQGTGKRKTSVARVILRPGDGTTWFNGRTIEEYFPRAVHRQTVLAPLKVAALEGRYDIRVRVHGGGPSGQAGAVRHGIARALVEADPELRVPLKRAGFLTRDARIVERKKAGLHKARKAPHAGGCSSDATRARPDSRSRTRSRVESSAPEETLCSRAFCRRLQSHCSRSTSAP